MDVVNRYEPVGSAVELFKSRGRIIGFDGPTRTGKSRACLEKGHACLLKYPGARMLLVRQTMRSLRNTALQTFEDDVLGFGHPLREGASRDTRQAYRYSNGSEITIAGLDDIAKILSGEYDLIFVQQMEECDFDDIQTLTTRLSGKAMPYRQLLFDCNPGPPTHWIKQKEAEGWLTLFHSRHEENPLLYDRKTKDWTDFGREYIAGLDELQGFVKDRLRYGLWVSAEGARFPHLDPSKHKFCARDVWPYGLPSTYKVSIGMDYGVAAPYCALWAAIDEDGNVWVFREDYETGLTPDLQAQRVVMLTGQNETIDAVYPDPAVYARAHGEEGSFKSIADSYQKVFAADPRFGGMVHISHSPDRRKMGLATIDVMLNHSDKTSPNLYIEKGCVNLWRELSEAVWQKDVQTGVAVDNIAKSCSDHAITSLYYLLGSHYVPPAREAVEPTYAQSRNLHHKEIHDRTVREFAAGRAGRRIRV